ncbi:MAG: hemolysin III family protein [Thermoleophilia bacterium]|nr:hemolysin III family protein [Thermoleophilia bacterium]
MAEQPARIALDPEAAPCVAEGPPLHLVAIKPHLRGVNHAIAFPLSLIATLVLTWFASGVRGHWAAIVFGTGVTFMFGTSGAYHRIPWPDAWAIWCRRMDHAAIFVTMAMIYTAIYIGALRGDGITTYLLIFAWVGAALGILFKLRFIDAPKHYGAGIYVIFGLTAISSLPTLVDAVGGTAVLLLLLSNSFTLAGAFVYAFERPNPYPHHFGFHEIFHLCVTISVMMQFGIMARWITG